MNAASNKYLELYAVDNDMTVTLKYENEVGGSIYALNQVNG